MKIGELATASGTTTKTIRFYEEFGLLPQAPRTESGYRIYAREDVERLDFIRKSKQLGLSLDDIVGILQLHDRSEPTCVHVAALLEEKIEQVNEAVRELRELGRELTDLREKAGTMADCHPSGGNICGIVERSEVTLSLSTSSLLSTSQASSKKGVK